MASSRKLPISVLKFSLLILLAGCDENLPEYKDPQGLFRPSLEAHFVFGPFLNVPDSTLKIFFNVTNVFDETFDAVVAIDGYVEITLIRDTSYHKTFRLTDAHIYSATNYNRTTRKLRIDPGDSLRLMVSWDFIDDSGRNLRNGVFQYKPDPTCFGRKFAPPEFFVLRGQLKLFDKTGYLFPPDTVYRLCHFSVFIPSCPRFPLDGECDYYFANVRPGTDRPD